MDKWNRCNKYLTRYEEFLMEIGGEEGRVEMRRGGLTIKF